MRNLRRAVKHCRQSWQMLCHVGSLNQHALSLSPDPVQAEIIVLEAGTSKWNFVPDCIIIRSSRSLKSRGCLTRVSEQTQFTRDATWNNGDKKHMPAQCLPSCYALLISQQTHQISLCIHLVLIFQGYIKSLTVLKTSLKKKSMTPFIFSRCSFTSGKI